MVTLLLPELVVVAISAIIIEIISEIIFAKGLANRLKHKILLITIIFIIIAILFSIFNFEYPTIIIFRYASLISQVIVLAGLTLLFRIIIESNT